MLEFSPCLAVHAITKVHTRVFSHLRIQAASFSNIMALVYTAKTWHERKECIYWKCVQRKHELSSGRPLSRYYMYIAMFWITNQSLYFYYLPLYCKIKTWPEKYFLNNLLCINTSQCHTTLQIVHIMWGQSRNRTQNWWHIFQSKFTVIANTNKCLIFMKYKFLRA